MMRGTVSRVAVAGILLAGSAVFAGPPAPLEGEFAIAPAGGPPAFKPYLVWKSHRTKAAQK